MLYLFSIDLGYKNRTSLFLAFAFALATIAWPYARIFFAEILLTFWLVLMAWAAYRYAHTERWEWLTLASVAMGLGIATKYVMVVAAPALALYMLLELRKRPDKARWAKQTIIAGGIPLALIGIGLLLFNYLRFHSIFETGYTAPEMRGDVSTWWGSPNLVDSLYGFFLSAGKGFFFFSPPTLLCLWGWGALTRRRKHEMWFFLSLATIYPLFYSLINNPQESAAVWLGGMAWGPRYLVCITPFLLLPVGAFLEDHTRPRHWRIGAASILFVVGFWVQGSNLIVNYNSYLFGDVPLERQLYRPTNSILLAQWRRWPQIGRAWQSYDHKAREAGLSFYKIESGFYDVEIPEASPYGRWMSGQGNLYIYAHPQQALTVRVAYSRPRQADVAGSPWTGLHFVYDGLPFESERQLIAESDHETQWQETIIIPADQVGISPGMLCLTATTWVPAAYGDPRTVSIFVGRIDVLEDTLTLSPQTIKLPQPLPVTTAYPWSWQAMVWFYDLGNPRPADLWMWYVWTSGLPLPQAKGLIATLVGLLGLGLLISSRWLIAAFKRSI